jgi:hypothetical protein
MDGCDEVCCYLFIRVGKITGAPSKINRALDASVVDQDVEMVELRCDPLHQRAPRSGPRYVADTDVELVNALLCREKALPTAAANDDLVVLNKSLSQREADSCSPARNEDRVASCSHG